MQLKPLWMGLLLIPAFFSQSPAQLSGKATFRMQDGKRIVGAILAPDCLRDTLQLSGGGGDTLLIPLSAVHRAVLRPGKKSFAPVQKHAMDIPEKGFFHELSVSPMFNKDDLSIGLHSVNGYRIAPYLAAGAGLGVDYYGSVTTLPLYAHIRSYFLNRNALPFLHADIGYAPAWASQDDWAYEIEQCKGGLFWQLGLGYLVPMRRTAMRIGLGYRSQHSQLDYLYQPPWTMLPPQEISEKRQLRRVFFSIGFTLF